MKNVFPSRLGGPLLLALTTLLGAALPLAAQTPAETAPRAAGAITGLVLDQEGAPVPGAAVRLIDRRQRTVTDESGRFRFEALPPGSYLVEAGDAATGTAVGRAEVRAGGAAAELSLSLDLTAHREEIVVTASPDPRSQLELASATSVLDSAELMGRLAPSLGETLSQQPGVTSTFFGPGASRPVIRGLGGDRIRVLEGGIGSGDASSTSPDHAVSIDPITAERIEVLRGPATLLYGSSATGGVVNILDGRIPDALPGAAVSGSVDARLGDGDGEQSANLSLSGGLGRFAWRAGGFSRQTDDYEAPGAPGGRVANSATESRGGSAGFSFIGADGFLGVAVGGLDSVYGNPAEEDVTIDLEQRRADLEGMLHREIGFLRGVKVRLGTADYEHTELEGAEVGTRFLNDSWEGRIEAVQKAFGALSGSFGVQAATRQFSALGEESFVPPTQTDSAALFTFQEITRGPLRYQLGVRYEKQQVDARVEEGIDRRDLAGVSGSLGVVWLASDGYAVAVSLARSVKLPNAEELFSNGPHLATNAFEIGDPTLEEEINLGAEVSLRKSTGLLTGELTFFQNRFDGFIFESFTGEEEDDLPVLRFTQRDAEFRGAELSGVWQLLHQEPLHVDIEFGADFVRAELRETGDPLPRIPPRRYRLGLHYRGEKLQALVEGVKVDRQDRVAAFETPTEGYEMLNANLGYRFVAGGTVYDLLLAGRNLTDEDARNHISFLKDVAPLPGRNVSLSLRAAF